MKAYLMRRRLALAVAAVFVGLTVNVWVQDGTFAFLIVLTAVVGCAVVIGTVGWTVGTQVVKHSRREAEAIGSGNHPMKEITR